MRRVVVFSTRSYDREALERVAPSEWQWDFIEEALDVTTVERASGAAAVCVFVNDTVDASILQALKRGGVEMVALRCSGYNNVDLQAARVNGIEVANVPHYTPDAVAEHTLLLMLAVLRNLGEAERRISHNNYSIDGLQGRLLSRLTVGLIGCGEIGSRVAELVTAVGSRLLIYDPYVGQEQLPGTKVTLAELLQASDVVSLHCPLTEETHNLIGAEALGAMGRRAILINTARGALVDTEAVLAALDGQHLGGFGCDVYAKEAGVFFFDHSRHGVEDPILQRLIRHPRALVTAHQGFLVEEALQQIAETTCQSLADFLNAKPLAHGLL